MFADLRTSNFIFDPVQREVDEEFLPWLKSAACSALAAFAVSHAATMHIVTAAMDLQKAEHTLAEVRVRAALEAEAAEVRQVPMAAISKT